MRFERAKNSASAADVSVQKSHLLQQPLWYELFIVKILPRQCRLILGLDSKPISSIPDPLQADKLGFRFPLSPGCLTRPADAAQERLLSY